MVISICKLTQREELKLREGKQMKIRYTCFMLSCLFLTSMINGYCKYSFIWYDFGIIKKDPNEPMFGVAKGSCPFKHAAHYGFVDQAATKGVKVYRTVRLNMADLRHVRKALKPFSADTKIADLIPELCQGPFCCARPRKKIVCWILRDFEKVKDHATVGDVRAILRL